MTTENGEHADSGDEHLAEISMDPDDWDAFRALAHRAVDDMIDSLSTIGDHPAWRPVSDAAKESLRAPLPREGVGETEAYRRFKESIEPYTCGNRHPGFYGWVQGGGTPLGMIADMLASGLNSHCAGFDQSSTYVELQVIEWLRQIFEMPQRSSGILVSGGSMANFIGLAAARDAAWFDPRSETSSLELKDLVAYSTPGVHGWAPKAAHLLGLVDDRFRTVEVEELELAIRSDRAEGRVPVCVIATAGTVKTGAFDDIELLAGICEAEGLWLHVDGAFGAWAKLSSTHASLVRGMERADSLALDLHKWGYLPFEVACVLVRDEEAHKRPFAISGSYLETTERGALSAGIPFAERGIELTREFRALKVWLSFVAYGVDRLARLVDQNIAQARYLGELVDDHVKLERLAPVPLNIVVFRFRADDIEDEELDALNEEILLRVQESGVAVPSSTRLEGRFGIRACFVNHRTQRADVERLVETVVRLGDEILETSSG